MEALGPLLLILLPAYFLPAIVALARSHPQAVAIFFLDLLAGWTFVGWVAALVWSLTATAGEAERTADGQPPAADPAAESGTRDCPRCAETIRAAAKVCRFCGHEFTPEAVESGGAVPLR